MNEITEEKSQEEIKQSRNGKIFFAIMGLLIIASIGVTYWRIMIKKDYVIEAQVDCDPYAEECFIWECDPESDVEGEACTGDPEEDAWYFQVIRRNASNIPLCDPNDEECEALTCSENEPECEYVFCTEDNMEEQYATSCNDPEQYALDNPSEGEVCHLENEEDCLEPEEEGVQEELGNGNGDGETVTEKGVVGEEAVCDPATEECADSNTEDSTEPCEEESAVCPLTQ